MRGFMEQRLSLITLGVGDLKRAANFYEAMGLKRHPSFTEGVVFYQLNGIILSLFPREELEKDAEIKFGPSQISAISLAYNTRSEEQVDEILEQAKLSGGEIVKPAKKVFWGGYAGYFLDTEGHLWEVAYNSSFPIDADGNISLPSSNK